MTIQEKAKAYEEALRKAKALYDSAEPMSGCNVLLETIFPELKESEDEKIRKDLITFLDDVWHLGKDANFDRWSKADCSEWIVWLEKQGENISLPKFTFDDVLALQCAMEAAKKVQKDKDLYEQLKSLHDRLHDAYWLEKQGEQYNNEDLNILQRFSFYSYKDEPNILYLSELYVNEKFRNKGIGTKILKVADEVAKSLNCHTIRLKTKKGSNAERLYQTHGYNSLATEESGEIWLEKQGERKPTEWNGEDDKMLSSIIDTMDAGENMEVNQIDWLRSLKQRLKTSRR